MRTVHGGRSGRTRVNLVPPVAEGIAELQTQFGRDLVTFEEDGAGGAFVEVLTVALPPPFNSPTWVGMHLTHTYPDSEIYPVFLRPDLCAKKLEVNALRDSTWRNRPATQFSLRVMRTTRDPASESATQKVLKTIEALKKLAE